MPSIEQNLERIATALETIAKNGGSLHVQHERVGSVSQTKVDVEASKPVDDKAAVAAKKAAAEKAAADKAAAEKAAADKEEAAKKAAEEEAAAAALGDEPTVQTSEKTKDDVRKALQAYREKAGTEKMLAALKKFGASSLNDLAGEKYDEICAFVV